MTRPPALSQSEKTMLVMEVLAGQLNLAQAAVRAGVSAQAVANWRRQFVEAGSAGLRPRSERPLTASVADARVRHLAREVNRLKVALAEAHLELSAARPSRSRMVVR